MNFYIAIFKKYIFSISSWKQFIVNVIHCYLSSMYFCLTGGNILICLVKPCWYWTEFLAANRIYILTGYWWATSVANAHIQQNLNLPRISAIQTALDIIQFVEHAFCRYSIILCFGFKLYLVQPLQCHAQHIASTWCWVKGRSMLSKIHEVLL